MSEALPGRELVEFPEDANANDLATFHDDRQREVDLQEAMEGTRYQEGGQHDLNPRGITSVDYDAEVQNLVDASAFRDSQYPQPQAAQFAQDQPAPVMPTAPQDGEIDYKQRYGQSENEKGDLRRALKEQLEYTQMLEMQANSNGQNGNIVPQYAPTAVPQYVPQMPAVNPQTVPGAPVPGGYTPPQLPTADQLERFAVKEDGEMVLQEDLDKVIREKVAPYVLDAYARTHQLEQRLVWEQEQRVNAMKAQIGITPQIEFQLVQANPWINTIPDPTARMQAMANLMRARQAQAVLQRTTPAVPQQGQPRQFVAPTAGVGRRVTYVERSAGAPGAEPAPQTDQAKFQAEWVAATHLPIEGGKRGNAQREVLRKYGVSEVSGFRDPNVSTR